MQVSADKSPFFMKTMSDCGNLLVTKAVRLRLLMQHPLCDRYYRFHIATQICHQPVSGPVCLRPKVRKDKETRYSDNPEFKCIDKTHNEKKGWFVPHLPPRSQSTAPF